MHNGGIILEYLNLIEKLFTEHSKAHLDFNSIYSDFNNLKEQALKDFLEAFKNLEQEEGNYLRLQLETNLSHENRKKELIKTINVQIQNIINEQAIKVNDLKNQIKINLASLELDNKMANDAKKEPIAIANKEIYGFLLAMNNQIDFYNRYKSSIQKNYDQTILYLNSKAFANERFYKADYNKTINLFKREEDTVNSKYHNLILLENNYYQSIYQKYQEKLAEKTALINQISNSYNKEINSLREETRSNLENIVANIDYQITKLQNKMDDTKAYYDELKAEYFKKFNNKIVEIDNNLQNITKIINNKISDIKKEYQIKQLKNFNNGVKKNYKRQRDMDIKVLEKELSKQMRHSQYLKRQAIKEREGNLEIIKVSEKIEMLELKHEIEIYNSKKSYEEKMALLIENIKIKESIIHQVKNEGNVNFDLHKYQEHVDNHLTYLKRRLEFIEKDHEMDLKQLAIQEDNDIFNIDHRSKQNSVYYMLEVSKNDMLKKFNNNLILEKIKLYKEDFANKERLTFLKRDLKTNEIDFKLKQNTLKINLENNTLNIKISLEEKGNLFIKKELDYKREYQEIILKKDIYCQKITNNLIFLDYLTTFFNDIFKQLLIVHKKVISMALKIFSNNELNSLTQINTAYKKMIVDLINYLNKKVLDILNKQIILQSEMNIQRKKKKKILYTNEKINDLKDEKTELTNTIKKLDEAKNNFYQSIIMIENELNNYKLSHNKNQRNYKMKKEQYHLLVKQIKKIDERIIKYQSEIIKIDKEKKRLSLNINQNITNLEDAKKSEMPFLFDEIKKINHQFEKYKKYSDASFNHIDNYLINSYYLNSYNKFLTSLSTKLKKSTSKTSSIKAKEALKILNNNTKRINHKKDVFYLKTDKEIEALKNQYQTSIKNLQDKYDEECRQQNDAILLLTNIINCFNENFKSHINKFTNDNMKVINNVIDNQIDNNAFTENLILKNKNYQQKTLKKSLDEHNHYQKRIFEESLEREKNFNDKFSKNEMYDRKTVKMHFLEQRKSTKELNRLNLNTLIKNNKLITNIDKEIKYLVSNKKTLERNFYRKYKKQAL